MKFLYVTASKIHTEVFMNSSGFSKNELIHIKSLKDIRGYKDTVLINIHATCKSVPELGEISDYALFHGIKIISL